MVCAPTRACDAPSGRRACRTCRGRRHPAASRPSTGRSRIRRRVRIEDPERRPGEQLAAGPNRPPAMSPPTSFALAASIRAGPVAADARIRSRNPGAKRSIWPRILSVASTVEPFGTWQYAQTVCRPAGARVGSNRLVWVSSTNGRSGTRPAATSASPRAISSSVPPRWTVAASSNSGACHGMGPSIARSSLKTPGPWRKPSSRRR